MTARAASERFEGFPDRDRRFFRTLARNQRREWFEAHREEYERGWHAPMKALLREVRDRIDPFFPRHPLAEPKVFRIHRDVRFAKDKSPYKTHIGGYVAIDGGRAGPFATAAVYVHLGADEVYISAGQYLMDPPQLAHFRAAVVDERRGGAVGAILRRLTRAGFTLGSPDVLQRVPRGFDPDHPRADLLKRKGLTVRFPDPRPDLLVARTFVDWLVTHTKRAVPLVEWLAAVME